jgi:hypothetical protein
MQKGNLILDELGSMEYADQYLHNHVQGIIQKIVNSKHHHIYAGNSLSVPNNHIYRLAFGQLEDRTHKPLVGSSNLTLGTKKLRHLLELTETHILDLESMPNFAHCKLSRHSWMSKNSYGTGGAINYKRQGL